MQHDIFISYSHNDKKVADAICETLEKRGIRCWLAPRNILPGNHWGSSIINAITNSRVFILVFSSHSNSSAQVFREVERAVGKNIPIIPFRVEEIQPSENLEYYLSATHWLDAFTPPLETHLNSLCDAFEKLLPDFLPRDYSPKQPSAIKSQPSIAVLPFQNMSADKEQEYFCDGMAEEIINALTHVEGLLVVARTSAFAFKGKNEDVREIGRKLDVETLLEGSVRRAGNRLRITAQLINVEDGYHLFSERFDRDMDDVFAIQDEISLAIVEKLKVELLSEEKKAIFKRHTEDIEAYKLYLKGRYFWNKRTEEGLRKSIEYFDSAIEKDSNYALAYAGLADSYSLLTAYSNSPSTEVYPKAKEAAQRAMDIDDTLAETRASLAVIKMDFEWDWTGAEMEFKRAIKLNPGYASAYQWYASLLIMTARFEEANKIINRALELDPLSKIINYVLSQFYRYSGKYDDAMVQFQKALELDPDFWLIYCGIGTLNCDMGNYSEAVSAFIKAKELTGDLYFTQAALGYAYGISGERDKAEKILDKLLEQKEEKGVSSYLIALIYLGLGENDKVFEWLERACEERDTLMTYIKVEPEFKKLHSDTRFKALIKKMGLES